jgi:hypothetical protein
VPVLEVTKVAKVTKAWSSPGDLPANDIDAAPAVPANPLNA